MKKAAAISAEVRESIRQRIYSLAEVYAIPPVYITAHVRYPAAFAARKHLMLILMSDFKLARYQIAMVLGRDRRRVRKSVLGM